MFRFLLKIVKSFIEWIFKSSKKELCGVVIYKVLAVAPGGMRAWVKSSVGVIKKPNSSIPTRLLKEAGGYNRNLYKLWRLKRN